MARPGTLSLDVHRFLDQLYDHESFHGHDVSIFQSSVEYAKEVTGWGAQRNLKPEVVLKPSSFQQVQVIAKLLYESTLDFTVRNGGVGSASARHVLISLGKLCTVSFDEDAETTTVGAGAVWTDVDSYMEREAPGWSVVSARTGYVGVAGIALIGGLSWLSHELGLISDPQNLLDVQIALADGRLIWASVEPELLWATRSGRCAFGIITQLKFRARRLQLSHVYSAQVRLSPKRLEQVSHAVSKHITTSKDPKMAFHVFFMNPESPFFPTKPGIGLILFDRNGPAHAHSPDGYQWALDIEEAEVHELDTDLYSVNKQTDFSKVIMGTLSFFDAAGLIDEVDEELLVRAKAWFDKVLAAADGELAAGSYFILERCQAAAFASTRPDETAWPHGKPKHVLQLGVGYAPEHNELREQALELLSEAFQTIPKTPLGKGDFSPTFLEPSFMDIKEMYGPHYDALQKIADKYDQRRRFRSIFHPDPNF